MCKRELNTTTFDVSQGASGPRLELTEVYQRGRQGHQQPRQQIKVKYKYLKEIEIGIHIPYYKLHKILVAGPQSLVHFIGISPSSTHQTSTRGYLLNLVHHGRFTLVPLIIHCFGMFNLYAHWPSPRGIEKRPPKLQPQTFLLNIIVRGFQRASPQGASRGVSFLSCLNQ